jgi:hypothetical protein
MSETHAVGSSEINPERATSAFEHCETECSFSTSSGWTDSLHTPLGSASLRRSTKPATSLTRKVLPSSGGSKEHYAVVELNISADTCLAPFRVAAGQPVVVEHADGALSLGRVVHVKTDAPLRPVAAKLIRHTRAEDLQSQMEIDRLRPQLVQDAMMHAALCGVGVIVYDAAWHLRFAALSLLVSATSQPQIDLFCACMRLAFPGKGINLILKM